MAELSMSAKSVIGSFAADLGVDAGAAPDGSYNFVFERMGTLSIMPTDRDPGVVIALARQPQTHSSDYERRLLAAGGIDRATNKLIYTAIAGDGSHIIAVDFDETRWSLPELDETLRFLQGLHNAVQ